MDGFQVAILALVIGCGVLALWVMMPVIIFIGAIASALV